MGTVRRVATAVAATTILALVGCTNGPTEAQPDEPLTVWTLEGQPDRVKTLESIAAEFTKQPGTAVKVVAVDEAQVNQLLLSGAASDTLPDVIGGLQLSTVGSLAANDLLDTKAAQSVVDSLGKDTFSPRALERASIDGELAAVPSDSWSSVLIYRKDLFDAAGLAAPDTYDKILTAAKTLNGKGRAGFVGFTDNQEGLEHFALANDCQVVDNDGKIVLDSPACAESFNFYKELISKYSVAGEQTVNSVRATYLSGGAAMAVFSPYILDELAGLRADLVPSCPECAGNPAYLAKNTGIVTTVKGPSGDGGQFGLQANWTIPAGSSSGAGSFVQFVMDAGYERWIGMAPEGKVPNRLGTKDNPTRFQDAWRKMSSGVNTKAPLSDFYSTESIDALSSSTEHISEWGIEQGQARLMGAILSEQPIVEAMTEMIGVSLTPEQATDEAAKAIRSVQDSLR